MPILSYLASFTWLLLAAPALANGNDLLVFCESEDNLKWGYCTGYAVGVADAAPGVCLPDRVTAGQIRDVVVQYLQTHAEIRHLPSAFLATEALIDAFTCKRR
jgi:hypothetical protein